MVQCSLGQSICDCLGDLVGGSTCMVVLVVSVMDCQFRGSWCKSWPGQKFGPRFLLHLCPSQLSYDVYVHGLYTVSGKLIR